MNKIPIDKRIKLQAIRQGISMSKIAKNIKTDSGVTISKQRFCDMIKGRRPNDLKRYKSQIANILEIRQF